MREIVNRVFTTVFSVLVLATAIILLLVATGAASEEILPYGWFSGQLLGVAEADGGDKAIAIAVSIIFILGMGAILVLEFMPRRKLLLSIRSGEDGILNVDGTSVCILAERVGSEVEGVKHIRSKVDERPDGVILSCDVLLALGSDILRVGSELQQRVKESVEKLTGLSIARVVINVRYEPVAPAESKGIKKEGVKLTESTEPKETGKEEISL
jgi:hypothetical protein